MTEERYTKGYVLLDDDTMLTGEYYRVDWDSSYITKKDYLVCVIPGGRLLVNIHSGSFLCGPINASDVMTAKSIKDRMVNKARCITYLGVLKENKEEA